MKYDLRNEKYVVKFCDTNGINENSTTEEELKALRLFIEQLSDDAIVLIMSVYYGDESDENEDEYEYVSREDMINELCDIYVESKDEFVDFEFKYYLDDIITFIVEELENYGIDYPDEFLE